MSAAVLKIRFEWNFCKRLTLNRFYAPNLKVPAAEGQRFSASLEGQRLTAVLLKPKLQRRGQRPLPPANLLRLDALGGVRAARMEEKPARALSRRGQLLPGGGESAPGMSVFPENCYFCKKKEPHNNG